MAKVLAISKKPRSYILKDYLKEENPPTFIIRSLTEFEKTSLANETAIDADMLRDYEESLGLVKELEKKIKVDDGQDRQLTEDEKKELTALTAKVSNLSNKIHFFSMAQQIKTLKKAVSGWDNLPVEGGMLEYSPDNIECLSSGILNELYMEAMGIVTNEEAENLEGPSLPLSGQEVKMDGVA